MRKKKKFYFSQLPFPRIHTWEYPWYVTMVRDPQTPGWLKRFYLTKIAIIIKDRILKTQVNGSYGSDSSMLMYDVLGIESKIRERRELRANMDRGLIVMRKNIWSRE